MALTAFSCLGLLASGASIHLEQWCKIFLPYHLNIVPLLSRYRDRRLWLAVEPLVTLDVGEWLDVESL